MKGKLKILAFLVLALCLSFTVALTGCSEPEGEVKSTLSVSKVYVEIEKGKTADIFAGYDGKTEIAFVSTNEDIATVFSEDGHAVITANNVGVAYINISVDGQYKTCKVVVFVSEYSIVLDREESELLAWVGVDHQITATVLKNGVEIDAELTWNVNGGEYDIVISNNRAIITFKEVGEYNVTVSYGDFASANYSISVVNQGK